MAQRQQAPATTIRRILANKISGENAWQNPQRNKTLVHLHPPPRNRTHKQPCRTRPARNSSTTQNLRMPPKRKRHQRNGNTHEPHSHMETKKPQPKNRTTPPPTELNTYGIFNLKAVLALCRLELNCGLD